MIGQNPKKSNVKKTTFFISYDVMFKYICMKKNTHKILKHANILKKLLLIFMKFV
jgi:hypothetical protein